MQISRKLSPYVFASLLNIAGYLLATANTYTVTSTNDAGAGSLRQAIVDANNHAGADTIVFNISTSDPGYIAGIGVWTIRPATVLPTLTDGSSVIDGTTQSTNQGDRNTVGPEIEIDGINAGSVSGFTIRSANNVLKGLVIDRFAYAGIDVSYTSARRNVISGNYIGTDATGMVARGNRRGGIWIRYGATNNRIGEPTASGRNLISGADTSYNITTGNGIYIERSDSNVIVGNYIGVNRDATTKLPNVSVGVCIYASRLTVVGGSMAGEGNVISGNGWVGVLIRLLADGRNVVSGNRIGTDVTGRVDLGNGSGVYLDFGSQRNTIGPLNVIAYNRGYGVGVNHDTSLSNTITQNVICGNAGKGIANTHGGNREIAPPTITSVSSTSISGTALPNSSVEIFSDSSDEGAVYQGKVMADASGKFTWIGAITGPRATATCTDGEGNTSEFSASVMTSVEADRVSDLPQQYSLSQNYPNPFNPTTVIRYALPQKSRVTLAVYNALGQIVKELVNGEMEAGYYEVTFEASGLSSGVYFYRIRAGDFLETKRLLLLR